MKECVRCGYCCQRGSCSVKRLVRPEAPTEGCPELRIEPDGTATCLLAWLFADMLKIGSGCCMPFVPRIRDRGNPVAK